MRAHPAESPELKAGPGSRRALLLVIPGVVAAFAAVVVIHRLLSSVDGAAPALAIAVIWLAGCAIAASLGSSRPRTGLALTAAGVLAAAAAWPWLLTRVDLIYLLQHAGTHALLAVVFTASLRAARRGTGDALITRIATRVHGTLPPEIHRYTVQVTVLWAAYFGLMTLASITLFIYGSTEAWSVLANLVTLPLVVTLFVAEYLWRRWRFPDFEHAALLDGLRFYK